MKQNNRMFKVVFIAIIAILGYIFISNGKESVSNAEANGDSKTTTGVTEEKNSINVSSTAKIDKNTNIVTRLSFKSAGEISEVKNALKGTSYFKYETIVESTSEILSKDVTEDGKITIVEKRKYSQAKEFYGTADWDISLQIGSTTIMDLFDSIKTIAPIMEQFLSEETAMIERGIDLIDNVSIKTLAEFGGIEIPSEIDYIVKDFFDDKVKERFSDVRQQVNKIENKEFKITYTQTKNGAPLKINFQNFDGTKPSEEEMELLRLVNLFIDSDILPSSGKAEVGETWTIDANEISTIVNPFSDQGCKGEFVFERQENHDNGKWCIKAKNAPLVVTYFNEKNTPEVALNIESAEILCDEEGRYIEAIQLIGSGDLFKMQKKTSLLFVDFEHRISANSKYEVWLTTEQFEKNK